MSPEVARLWVSVVRDMAIVFTAMFLAIFEAVAVHEPNIYVLALAGTLFGVPAALRADALLGRGKGEEKSNGGPDAP